MPRPDACSCYLWLRPILHALAQEDEDAAELDEAEVVERIAFVPHHEATEGAQPGEEPFDLPAAFVAPQWSAILRFGFLPVPAMWRDHLHTQLGQFRVEGVGVVGAVANEASRQGVYESRIERGSDETDLVRRS
jgi:hypothetical protein